MKKILNLILKKIGSLSTATLVLSANTTSGWIAHQPPMPNDIKKFKI